MQRLDDEDGVAEALGTKEELQERLLLELFQARTDWKNAWAPANQVARMTARKPAGVCFAPEYYPVLDGSLVRSAGRASPQPVGAVVALDMTSPEELAFWTDVVIEDRIKRLPPGTVVSASAVRVKRPPGGASIDLRGGLIAGTDATVYTRDGYRGPAVVSQDELVLELPHPVAGSAERDARTAVVLAGSGADPHDAVMRGAPLSAVHAGSMAETYDLLRPFPVDIARRQPAGTTTDELADALRAQGRELFGPTSGPAESASMRFLISRMADGVRPEPREYVEIEDMSTPGDATPAQKAQPRADDLNRLKQYERSGAAVSAVDLSGSTPWKAVREAKAAADAESNRADAARTFRTDVPTGDAGVARVPPLRIKDDGRDWSFVPGAGEVVFDASEGRVGVGKASEELLGAQAEILAAFALIGAATGMRWQDDLRDASAERLLASWTQRVPDTAAVDADVAALVEAGLDDASARVAALDAACASAIGPAGRNRDVFVAEAASECLTNCVATSIRIGRPSIDEISGRMAMVASVAGMRDYCSSRLSDARVFTATAARRFHDFAAVALGRLPPNADQLLRPAARTRESAPRTSWWEAPSAVAHSETIAVVRQAPTHADPVTPVFQRRTERVGPPRKATAAKPAKPLSRAPAMTGLPYLKSCIHDTTKIRAYRAAACASGFVALLRSKTIHAHQKAFTLSMDSKSASDFMAKVADIRAGLGKRGSGVSMPTDAATPKDVLSRFIKTLQDAHPKAAALFDAYCAANAQAPKRAETKQVTLQQDVDPGDDSSDIRAERDRVFDDVVNDVRITYELYHDDSDGDEQ